MPLKLAVAGFRHGHIRSLYELAGCHPEVEVVAAAENDAPTRQALAGQVRFTHDSCERMIEEVGCDAVAVGDYYARRGGLAIAALERGRHLIGDKPLCTRLDELDRIAALARAGGLQVGCMLTMRDAAPTRGLRALVREGRLGQLHAISFGGQHPLMLGSRPAWYFEPGKHGGTLNDIGVHAFDALPWITGLEFGAINAARSWNAFAPQFPHFRDGGQVMLTMTGGCGVLGDVSYFSPDKAGYSLPLYWRLTLWGREGVAETSATAREISLALAGDEKLRSLPLPPGREGGYLEDFLAGVQGRPAELDSAAVLRAARLALRIQQAADQGLREVVL
ncbi:MAG: Gfo/Idh/MocA family oxidoreductase [Candidatus Handelsmanbacteria bacterium]|nr:Gfo/Idh/MocA family oxidoreductase [Candidatus Handelsmanbacteria bacterium]